MDAVQHRADLMLPRVKASACRLSPQTPASDDEQASRVRPPSLLLFARSGTIAGFLAWADEEPEPCIESTDPDATDVTRDATSRTQLVA